MAPTPSPQAMQRWTKQSRCIFCDFRARLKQPRSINGTAVYFSSSSSSSSSSSQHADKRSSKSPIRHDGQQQSPSQKPKAKALPKSPAFKIRRVFRDGKLYNDRNHNDNRYDEEEHKLSRAKRKKDILRALARVHSFYASAKMSQASNVSQLEGLDPEQSLWPQFAENFKEALEASGSTKRGIINELVYAKESEEFMADAERTIRFAFLDYVLDHGDVITVGGKQEIDLRYPTEWYPLARMMQRVVHLHVGPTNSGKTYNALKRLEKAGNGFYAGPLRLLAHEVYSRFKNRGVKCDLVTGDDVRLDDSGEVELYSSTVEMVDTSRVSEVGVIDEIQMMGDHERGWAWTRALLAAQVKELHLCGEVRVVPLIREIVASMGDTLHIHEYERLNPLKVMSRSLKGNLQNLRKGDCVVSFSIVNIHALKRQIELDTGKHCAVIYGGLPPETRAQQAALFNDPDNDYDFLAASDAIGMGLNLSIKRIVFETTKKFNGTFREDLSIPQIKQIAGRAGRYRTALDDKQTGSDDNKAASKTSSKESGKPKSVGLVTCIDEVNLQVLQNALSKDGPPLKVAGIFPPGEFYERLATRLPENTPFEYILRRMNESVTTNHRFRLCSLKDQLQIARVIEEVKGLTIAIRLTICAAPIGFHSRISRTALTQTTQALAKAIAEDRPMNVADFTEIPLEVLDEPMTADRDYLASLETLHKCLILYLWLSYRFPRALGDQDMAVRAQELCEEKINTTLIRFSANPRLSQRLANIRKSSELLREQAKERGWAPIETPLMMNPDQPVEEIDTMRVHQGINQVHTDEVELEENVEVDGELDLGNDEGLVNEIGEKLNQQAQRVTDDHENLEELERAKGSG